MHAYYLAVVLDRSPGRAADQPAADSSKDPDNVYILCHSQDLSSFSFYQRSVVAQFLGFFAKTVASRTASGQRQSVQEQTYTAHVYNPGDADNLRAVIITDQEYPVRPAFSALTKLLEEFRNQVPLSQWEDDPSPKDQPIQAVDQLLTRAQDPVQLDSIMKVQQELDETKIILHKTIQSVLERGEKIDNLVDRSNMLSQQSKAFYKTAKKQNSCCVVM